MKKILYFLICMLVILFYGCSKETEVVGGNKIAEGYIKTKGYNIILNQGQIQKYTMTKEKLKSAPYDDIWAMQKVNTDQYIGEDIIVYGFIVTNHPLDQLKNNYNKRTKLYIMISNNKVIGGYSIPDSDSVGGYYSLEGEP